MYKLNNQDKRKIHDRINSITLDETIELKKEAISEASFIKAMSIGDEPVHDDMHKLFMNFEIIARANAKLNKKGRMWLMAHRETIINAWSKSHHLNVTSNLNLS